jgi:hypothetical protein
MGVAGHEPLEQLGEVVARSQAEQRPPVHPEPLNQLRPARLGDRGVAVHGERALHRPARDLVVRHDDPELPHPWPALPQRAVPPPAA